MQETVLSTASKTAPIKKGPTPMRRTGAGGNANDGSPDIETIEIVEHTGDYQEPIAIGVYGDHGSGKSRLVCTGPQVVGAIPLDQKAKQTIINDCKKYGKRLFLPNIDLVRVKNPMLTAILKPACQLKTGGSDAGNVDGHAMDDITKNINIYGAQPMCCAIHHFRWHVNRVKHTAIQMAEHTEIEILCCDSGTNMWDDILFANHGRTNRINPIDRQSDNREMQEFLGILRRKHFVLTHKEGEVWKNNKPTGEVDYKGYAHLGYEVSAILHMIRDKRTGQFRTNFEMCQANEALHGNAGQWDQTELYDDNIGLAQIAQLMYPDGDFSHWL